MADTKTPKAVLYAFPGSVWSSVVFLALEEKGFGPDEIDLKTVDLFQGENFSPSFLRINPAATVPSLVVPLEKSLAHDEEVRYKAINDTKAILEFLDKSRSVISKSKTTSSLPAPMLAPASLALSSLSTQIIAQIRSPTSDPNFLFISATSTSDLSLKPKVKTYLTNRENALSGQLSANAAATNPFLSAKTIAFLQSVRDLNGSRLAVYDGTASDTEREAFFAHSREAWTLHLRAALDTLERLIGGGGDGDAGDGVVGIAGPYALGDQLSLADLHLMAWLARIVSIAGGKKEKEGIDKLEDKIGAGWKVGEKLGAFWEAILDRPSFRKVYADGLY